MPTMNVSLTPEMADFVAEELASGDYATASEIVRDGLRLLRRAREIDREKLEILRLEIRRAEEQAAKGEFSDRSVAEIARAVLAEQDG